MVLFHMGTTVSVEYFVNDFSFLQFLASINDVFIFGRKLGTKL